MKVRLFRINIYQIVENIWYKKNVLGYLLWPLSIVFRILVFFRRLFLENFKQQKFSVPIIIVGNISVGGVGKTPLVIAIADKYTKQGLKVGIVSRGYKSSMTKFPYVVKKSDSANLVGDEPLLLALRTNCPVIIDPNRCRAVEYIIENYKPDIIISDDGLQHYKLGRAVEIVVIDANRGIGNGFCLPAGPLRESVKRLDKVDFIIVNGKENNFNFHDMYIMTLEPQFLRSCLSQKSVNMENINFNALAIAAIGNPDRFFNTLKKLGLDIENKKYPDHYKFSKSDFIGIERSIIMTEKDFVKCRDFADDRMFFLPVSAMISESFWDNLNSKLGRYRTYDKLRGQGGFSI